MSGADDLLLIVVKQAGEEIEGLRGIKGFKIPDPYVKPENFKIISEHHPIEEPDLFTLQDLKEKWRGRMSGWLIESAWMMVGRNAGRADAALEILEEDRKK